MMSLLRSSEFAVVVGAAIFAALAILAYTYLGWFGVGLLGLVALSASLRAELYEGHGNVIEYDSHRSVDVFAKQLNDQNRPMTDGGQAEKAKKKQLSRMFRVINAVFFSVMVLGFGMFTLRALA